MGRVLLDDPAHAGGSTQLFAGTVVDDHSGTPANVLGASLKQWAADVNAMTGEIYTGAAINDSNAATKMQSAALVFVANVASLSGFPTQDGVTLAQDGAVVLLTAQTTASQNGPWATHSGAWTRPTWWANGNTFQAVQHSQIQIRLGTQYAGSTWRLTTAGAITIDTTSTAWLQTAVANGALAAAPALTMKGNLSTAAGAVNDLLVSQIRAALGAAAGPPRPFTVSAAPTIAYGSSQVNTQRIQAMVNPGTNNAPNTNLFSFSANPSNLGPRNPSASPQTQVLQSTYATEAQDFSVQFYHSGKSLDIFKYGSGAGFSLWIDDVYIGTWQPYLNNGTAQAGASGTITLASGASAVNGQYVGYSVNIVSGTGAGQTREISGYVGSTKVATMLSNWTTAPDSTSVYVICDDTNGYYAQPLDGSVRYITLTWPTVGTRKITYMGVDFGGLYIGTNDTIAPAPFEGSVRALVIGDSFIGGTGGPYRVNPPQIRMLGRLLGAQVVADGAGGTGWFANNVGVGLSFMDRMFPPAETFKISQTGGTGGTFTLSVTYGGSTQTTGTIAYNATAATVQTALAALSNVSSVSVGSGVGYPPFWVVILRGMPGATLSANMAGITGLTASGNSQWLGVLPSNVPLDHNGNPLPFIIYVQGSGNDQSSTTAAQTGTNATYAAQQLKALYPTAVVIFSGIVSISSAVLTSGNIAYNTALAAAAAYLNPINGNVPFIDTYATGVGGNGWITGSGNVAAPTASKNDILQSLTFPGHPTGDGHALDASRVAQGIRAVLAGF